MPISDELDESFFDQLHEENLPEELSFEDQLNQAEELVRKATGGYWSVEPHGPTTALYADRIGIWHGLRLMNLDDGDANFQNNIDAIPAVMNVFLTLAQNYRRVEEQLTHVTVALGQHAIKAGHLAETASDIDQKLAQVLNELWEDSSDIKRQELLHRFPCWKPGHQSATIEWRKLDSDDIDTGGNS